MTGPLPGSCSLAWDDPALPAWGTAATARFIVALEQPGAWGADALTQSGLDPAFGARLERACAAEGGRPLLIRTPDAPHPDLGGTRPRRVLLAGGFDDVGWVVRSDVLDAESLLDLPLDRLAGWTPGQAAALGWEPAPPALLVCTNGRRDACCALTGRGLAAEVAATHPGLVWEASHLGGHRFAPTAVVLPLGVSLGRLTPPLARDALDAAAAGLISRTSLDPQVLRGRASLAPQAQVADAAVRLATGAQEPGALRAQGAEGWTEVRHRDGRRWRVTTSREPVGQDRPVSCGKPDEPTMVWRLGAVEAVPAPDLPGAPRP